MMMLPTASNTPPSKKKNDEEHQHATKSSISSTQSNISSTSYSSPSPLRSNSNSTYRDNPFYNRASASHNNTPQSANQHHHDDTTNASDQQLMQQALLPPSPFFYPGTGTGTADTSSPVRKRISTAQNQQQQQQHSNTNTALLINNVDPTNTFSFPSNSNMNDNENTNSNKNTNAGPMVTNITMSRQRKRYPQPYTTITTNTNTDYNANNPITVTKGNRRIRYDNHFYNNHLLLHKNNNRNKTNKHIMNRNFIPQQHRHRQRHRRSKVISSLQRFLRAFQLPLAILSWYLLGVLSISTTKILLRDYGFQSTQQQQQQQQQQQGSNKIMDTKQQNFYTLSPLFLTIQQLSIGLLFLKIWIRLSNLQPLQVKIPLVPSFLSRIFGQRLHSNMNNNSNHDQDNDNYYNTSSTSLYLFLTSTCFSLGFYITNQSFHGSDASFVETIKASEPLTSASIAVLWGLETLSRSEVGSLLCICGGVVLSTVGSAHSKSSSSSSTSEGGSSASIASIAAASKVVSTTSSSSSSLNTAIMASSIVFLSNICFSFRGLFQKLLRATPLGNKDVIPDLYLQFMLHQIGIGVLFVPVLIMDVLPTLSSLSFGNLLRFWSSSSSSSSVGTSLGHYFALAFVNGFAFTHYNLASSFVLTRVSVVHHAALNCIRRLFAIVVTSVVFGVPIGWISALGILVSILGFMAFTHYKMNRKKIPEARPLSSLLPLSQ